MAIVDKIRSLLKENNVDYLLVNSTNEFLMEYADLQENSRYHLTGFSGSTGDALVSQDKVYLFVDGRYHEQAEQEANAHITVVKMKLGESLFSHLLEKVEENKTLALISKKTSQARYEALQKLLEIKKVQVKLIDNDPIESKKIERIQKIEEIDVKITGLSTEEKIQKITKKLKPNEAIFVSSPEEAAYVLNKRDFSANFNSSVREKYLITKNSLCHPEPVSGSYHIAELNRNINEFNLKQEDYSKIQTIYLDKNSTSAYDYNFLGEKATELIKNPIREMKSIKNKSEIAHYKKCFERTDKAILATKEFIENNKNVSEYDIAKKLEENFYKFGAKSLSFKSIVAIDKNSALAHYSKCSKDVILKNGSLVLIDCGAYYEGGYATDCTRVFVKGKPSKLQKQVYTTVLKGFLKAFNKKITENITGFNLDKAARKIINEIKPDGFEFSHSLGHGIGISVHEAPPSLSPSELAKTALKPNMCFTIEPGLYNPKHFGVRLENSCYLAKKKGELKIKSFTNLGYEEKLIDFDMLTQKEKNQLTKQIKA